MKIGVIKEIKTHEYRVGLTPSCGAAYVSRGHVVMVEAGAGVNAGFEDAEYAAAGAQIAADKKEIFDACEMIIKVKEPVAEEYGLFHPGQILYTYLHLAADLPLAKSLMASRVNAVARADAMGIVVSSANREWIKLWADYKKEVRIPSYHLMTDEEILEGLLMLESLGR